MILADKIINLRKKSGMSQEELADKIGVSRQAVSKWESMQAIPDLDKILKMSKLFNVSTDFLLKDEIEVEEARVESGEESDKKTVTMEMANDFIRLRMGNAGKIAAGVVLCILCPIPLFILGYLSEIFGQYENILVASALASLFVMVAIAVCLFVSVANKLREYEFLEREEFETQYGVTGMAKEKKKEFTDIYSKNNILGIVTCILSVIPLFIGIFSENDLYGVIGLCTMFFFIAFGVYKLVAVGYKMGGLQSLLQEGDYSRIKKRRSPVMNVFSSCYWCIVTAVYLAWSFISQNWAISWIVWPIAGVLFGGIYEVIALINKKK